MLAVTTRATARMPALENFSAFAQPARPLSAPAVLPDLLADHATDARLRRGRRHDPMFRRVARNFEQQFGADRFLEFFAVLDRHHDRAGPPDDAALITQIHLDVS